MATDWKQLIVQLVFVKQSVAEHDAEGLWQYRLPGIAATEDQLQAVERSLGEALDPMYRSFLAHAGGWPAFYQTVDLFGPSDLLGSDRFRDATRMMSYLDENVLHASGVRRDQLLPIAATSVDLDLFVITRASAATPGVVLWFAGQEIDRFPNFEEYFRAMVDYNRAELEDLIRTT